MIRPLRDLLVAVPCEESGRFGLLIIPENHKQALVTHRKMLVLAAGPKAKEEGIESGVIIHASELWGDCMEIEGKKCWMGRSRDINGIVEGEVVVDTGRYLD